MIAELYTLSFVVVIVMLTVGILGIVMMEHRHQRIFFSIIVGGSFILLIFTTTLPPPEPSENDIKLEEMMSIANSTRNCTELQDIQLEIIEEWNRAFVKVKDVFKMAQERYEVLCP